MKQGLCESVAPEKSSAGGEGSPDELNAEDAAEFLLDTSIDLGGSLCPQRLTADARQVTSARCRMSCSAVWRTSRP